MVVAHGAREVGEIGGLAREAFKQIRGLRRGLVERVVERGGVRFAAAGVDESFFAEIGEAAVDVEIDALKIVQIACESKDALRKRGAHLKWLRRGFLVELANVPGAGAGLVDLDLDKFREARLENLAIGDGGAGRRSGMGVRAVRLS